MEKTKFQVKYEADREATRKKARISGLIPRPGGGAPTKGGEPSEAQLIIPLKDLGGNILISPTRVQVSWPGDYEDIVKIELLLNEIVVLMPNEGSRFGEETRKNVQNKRMFEHQMESLREDLDAKERMDSVLGRAAQIKDGRTSDYLR